jgi:type IV secretion system protein VirD4
MIEVSQVNLHLDWLLGLAVGDAVIKGWIPRQVAAATTPPELFDGWRWWPRVVGAPLEPVDSGLVPDRLVVAVDHNRNLRQARRKVHMCAIGPPQGKVAGKTSAVFVPNVLSWRRGPVVCASTKPDIADACYRARLHMGQVWLFDPLEYIENPELHFPGIRLLKWSPLRGGKDWNVALSRGAALTAKASTGTTDATHWRNRAGQILALFLHAAAWEGLGMSQVRSWASTLDISVVEDICRRWELVDAYDTIAQVKGLEERERGYILSALQGALKPFDHSRVRANADASERCGFDVDDFLGIPQSQCDRGQKRPRQHHDALFVIAPVEDESQDIAPLVCGLVGEIHNRALRIAVNRPQRTLPYRLLLALDEAAHITPLPTLPAMLGQSGSQGVTVILGFQELTQAMSVWGQEFPSTLLTLCGVLLVLPGVKSTRTLETLSTLVGTYRVHLTSVTHKKLIPLPWRAERQKVPHDVPRMPPHRIREMNKWRCLVIMDEEPAELMSSIPAHRTAPFKRWSRIGLPAWVDHIGARLDQLPDEPAGAPRPAAPAGRRDDA